MLVALVLLPVFSVGADAQTDASLHGLLSAPMPGTRAREQAELSATLEHALSSFDGVEAVRVIISPSSESAADSPNAAVQMTLSEGFTPNPGWLRAICALCIRTIPLLDRQRLTVVESSGRILYDSGETLLTAPTAAPVVDATFAFEPWWLSAAAAVGFLVVIAGVMTHRALRKVPEPVAEPRGDGPLDFLARVPDDRIISALSRERPEVIAAVLTLAPEAVARRLRQHEELSVRSAVAISRPGQPMIAALAAALRERLMSV
ncbi:MAG: hypothetical protein ACOCZ7_01195 [Armatimonadota bacterium]